MQEEGYLNDQRNIKNEKLRKNIYDHQWKKLPSFRK